MSIVGSCSSTWCRGDDEENLMVVEVVVTGLKGYTVSEYEERIFRVYIEDVLRGCIVK